MTTDSIQPDTKIDEVDAVEPQDLPAASEHKQEASAAPPSNTAVADRKTDISLSPEGTLSPVTHTELWRISETFLKSKTIPKQFENVAQVFMAAQFLREHGISYATGLRQTTIINGTLSIWGELPLGLCRASGKLEWITEKIYTKDYEEICFSNKNVDSAPFYAVCQVLRAGDPEPVERVFSMEDAKTAGLLSKNNSVWKFYPKRMLQMRARSWVLKDTMADVLSGIAIAEYDHDLLLDNKGNEVKVLESGSDIADELNKTYLGEVKENPEPKPASIV